MDKEKISKFGDIEETGSYIKVSDKSFKKALVMKHCVHLEDSNKVYGEKMRVFSQEEIKKRHMGKTKCIVQFSTDKELQQILQAYFCD